VKTGDGIPEGFVPVEVGGEFASHNGPLHARWRDGFFELGFRVGPQHVNPGNACHGGMLCMFADILLSTAAQYQVDMARCFLPTITLQTDFLAPAPLGSWVHGRAEILQVTAKLVFSKGIVGADGVDVMRASGVFRRGPLLPDTDSDHELQLPGMPRRLR
jgi:uncharacterized protein (TIGR00369 family)